MVYDHVIKTKGVGQHFHTDHHQRRCQKFIKRPKAENNRTEFICKGTGKY